MGLSDRFLLFRSDPKMKPANQAVKRGLPIYLYKSVPGCGRVFCTFYRHKFRLKYQIFYDVLLDLKAYNNSLKLQRNR